MRYCLPYLESLGDLPHFVRHISGSLPEGEICRTLCVTSPAPCRRGPCKLFEAHGLTALGLFPHKSLQEQAPDGLARKKPSAAR